MGRIFDVLKKGMLYQVLKPIGSIMTDHEEKLFLS